MELFGSLKSLRPGGVVRTAPSLSVQVELFGSLKSKTALFDADVDISLGPLELVFPSGCQNNFSTTGPSESGLVGQAARDHGLRAFGDFLENTVKEVTSCEVGSCMFSVDEVV